MTITLEVPTELEQRLATAAQQHGIDQAAFLRNLLEENLPNSPEFPPFDLSAKILATDLPVRDRTAEYTWLEKHRDEYVGQYVALLGDTLIAAGINAKEVATSARTQGIDGALVLFVEGIPQARSLTGGLWR